MSWKLYLIVITNAAKISTAEVPEKIGVDNLSPKQEISLHQAQSAKGLFIGKHKDKLVIVSQDLVFDFYEKSPSDFEKKVLAAFPNSEIAVLTLNGTTDLYGYSIIKDGKRQRVKSGADLELYVDYGEKLQEEIDVLKEKLFDDDELQEMKEEYSKQELKKVIDQEVSIRAAFRLSKRYFGKAFDEAGSDFEKIKVTQYE